MEPVSGRKREYNRRDHHGSASVFFKLVLALSVISNPAKEGLGRCDVGILQIPSGSSCSAES
jgi:hypothetical protein